MTPADRTSVDVAPVEKVFDVAVVGAGVVGSAIARRLVSLGSSVVLLEARDDVGAGTSKANTAILHTGFDAVPGSLEARLVRRGYDLLSAFAAEVGIPVEPVGALLVAWDDEQLAALPGLTAKAQANGYHETRLVGPAELYRREPHLGPGALGALEVPGESIICPWTTTLALATQAVLAGVALRLNTEVVAVEPATADVPHVLQVTTPGGPGRIRARYLVNVAGLASGWLDSQVVDLPPDRRFTVTPRRGQLIVFDKLARPLVSHILLPVPSKVGKGVLVAPTVYGNVMLGPTAEDVTDPADTGSTQDGLDFLLGHGRRIMPDLLDEEVTTVYAGLRAATEHPDYQLRSHPDRRYVCVGGIRSTGLTASLAIGEHVADLLAEAGLATASPVALPPLTMPMIGEAFARPYQRADLIAADPEYGRIVCHCERVTRGELRDALASPIPPVTVEGLRRRTRAQLGRCQGFFCGAEVQALVEAGR